MPTSTHSYETVYCPDCGEDYTLAYVEDHESVYVLCECEEIDQETAIEFIQRFRTEHLDLEPAEIETDEEAPQETNSSERMFN